MRYAEPRTSSAVLDGRAEYLGNLIVGDEIDIPSDGKFTGQIKTYVDFIKQLPGNNKLVEKWSVDGFMTNSKLRVHPLYLAGEGLQKLEVALGNKAPADVQKVLIYPGWQPSVDIVFSKSPQVIRRNTLGEPRWKSRSGMPVSWRVTDPEA